MEGYPTMPSLASPLGRGMCWIPLPQGSSGTQVLVGKAASGLWWPQTSEKSETSPPLGRVLDFYARDTVRSF